MNNNSRLWSCATAAVPVFSVKAKENKEKLNLL
jgi:hypothetical protein